MNETVASLRLAAQLLAGAGARGPVEVAERLLAIQAQDPRAARLAIRARSGTPRAADVDRELTERRSLLITWCNRGTLHLIRREDYPLLQLLTTPPLLTGSSRRLAQEGIDARMSERGVAVIERELAASGPLPREALRERLGRAGVPVAGQALVQLLFRASLEGRIVRGPMAGREHAFVLVRDWLGECRPPDRDLALRELALRYLAGHGPASERDLARWAGLPLRDARAGLTALADRLSVGDDGLVDLRRRRDPPPLPPPPRLLGAFEPVLLGWCSRAAIVGEHAERIVSGGVFRAFALVGGRAAALWRLRGAGAEVELEPFAGLNAADARALSADGEAARRFLGLPHVQVL